MQPPQSVEEIKAGLETTEKGGVRQSIRNWDETISTVPPYTLVNNSFQNWRGMQESGGRRVNKNIFLDMTTQIGRASCRERV